MSGQVEVNPPEVNPPEVNPPAAVWQARMA
jgi:hypothetical protein